MNLIEVILSIIIWCINFFGGAWIVQRLFGLVGGVTNHFAPNDDYFTPESFIRIAERRTKLKADFDEGENEINHINFRLKERLRVLLGNFRSRQHQLYLPKYIIREQLVVSLVQRIYVNHCFKQHPDIKFVPIFRPIFITGLWRTGTTFLHSLLCKDSTSKAPLMWEMVKPYPPPEKETFTTDPRIKEMTTELMAVELMTAGEHKNIHDLVATAPEECSFIFFLDLVMFNHLLTNQLPDYAKYINEKHDMKSSYIFYRQMLQLLAYKNPPKHHYVLKAPYPHLFHLPTLLEIFPDAAIVMCHRDPISSVPSSISLNTVFGRPFWKDFDLRKVSQHMLGVLSKGATQAMEFREQLPENVEKRHFFDCYFEDFVKNPIETVKSIYNHFNYEYTDEFEKRIYEALQSKSAQPKKHDYSLQDFGLTEKVIRNAFQGYCQKHNYPRPKVPSHFELPQIIQTF